MVVLPLGFRGRHVRGRKNVDAVEITHPEEADADDAPDVDEDDDDDDESLPRYDAAAAALVPRPPIRRRFAPPFHPPSPAQDRSPGMNLGVFWRAMSWPQGLPACLPGMGWEAAQ